MDNKQAYPASDSPGLVAGLLGIARNLLGLVLNRIELASLELSGISANFVKIMVLCALALVALWFAVAFWAVLLVFLAWEFWGWKILFAFGGFFTVLTIGLAWYVRSVLRQGKLSLPMTMSELRKDRDALL